MSYADRLAQIDALIVAVQAPALVEHLGVAIAELTERLINNNDEQTRGRIKALRDLINLPEGLRYERLDTAAALSEQSDAA